LSDSRGDGAPFDVPEIDRLLSTTKAVRKRLDLGREVPVDVVLDCLRVAMQAPNASNAQSWRWLVVADEARRAALGELYRVHITPPMQALLDKRRASGDAAGVRHSESVLHLGEVFGQVPVIVAPCFEGRLEDGWSLDRVTGLLGSIYPAVWSFQLALRSRGLGSTFTTAHVLFEREARELLDVPDTHTVACLLPVAYTKGTDFRPAPRVPVEDVTFVDTWGNPA
jgi:nitroreductase